jgi:3-deoxy-D-manno-octulosonate 8-phosphate phosphatase (KDO 8-P phosphatase)
MLDFPKEVLLKAASVELFLFDVDGVLTDGRIYIDDNGCETKAFNSMDGAGLKYLPRYGVRTGVITGRKSDVVAIRAAELGMAVVIQSARDKLAAFNKALADTGLPPAKIAFMGDDLVDLPILTRVALSVAPPSSHPEVLKRVDYVTKRDAGMGAAREAVELVLKAKGVYDELLARYLAQDTER